MGKERNNILGIEIDSLVDMIRSVVRDEMEACITDCRFGADFKDEAWDRKTVADFLKVSPEKVTEMYNRKEIPGRKLGREYFFLKSQIINMLKKGKQ